MFTALIWVKMPNLTEYLQFNRWTRHFTEKFLKVGNAKTNYKTSIKITYVQAAIFALHS